LNSFLDDLINSIRGIQQFAAARSNRSFIGTGDARQEEASLDLLVPNSSQVWFPIYKVLIEFFLTEKMTNDNFLP
jgi:hypothetical protein